MKSWKKILTLALAVGLSAYFAACSANSMGSSVADSVGASSSAISTNIVSTNTNTGSTNTIIVSNSSGAASSAFSTNIITTNTNQGVTNTVSTNYGGTNLSMVFITNPTTYLLEVTNFVWVNTNWTISNNVSNFMSFTISNFYATNVSLVYGLVATSTNSNAFSVVVAFTNNSLILGGTNLSIDIINNPLSLQILITNWTLNLTNWTVTNTTTPTEVLTVSNYKATNVGLAYALVSTSTNRVTNTVITGSTNFTVTVVQSISAAINTLPELKVELPESLSLKLKLKAPQRAPYDVTDLSDFAALPGVKSAAWMRVVQNAERQSSTVSIMNGIKDLAQRTNLLLGMPMNLGHISNWMGMMTLSNNILFVESPGTNVFNIWWVADTAAKFGSDMSPPIPFSVQCYLEINAADTNKVIANVFTKLYTNGAPFAELRGLFDGSNGQVFDIERNFNGPGTYSFKQSYKTNGQTYMLSKQVSMDYMNGSMSTNYNIAYGDAMVGGIVDVGGWNGDGALNMNREVYDQNGHLIYKGWGDTKTPDWAFGWATNNGFNLKQLGYSAGTLPQKFLVMRKGINASYNEHTNLSQLWSNTYWYALVTNVQTNIWSTYSNEYTNEVNDVYTNVSGSLNEFTNIWTNTYTNVTSSMTTNYWTNVQGDSNAGSTNINYVNRMYQGGAWNHTNYDEVSWSVDGVNWTVVTDPVMLSNIAYTWGVYFMGNQSVLATGDSTYFWSPAGSGYGWTNFSVSNTIVPEYETNIVETWNQSFTNHYLISVESEVNTNVWSNVQAFDISFTVPSPESIFGKGFYVQNSYPLKYLSFEDDMAGYSIRRMERQTWTNSWTNIWGTNTNAYENIYTEYEWWLSHPMWSNQTIFTNVRVETNEQGYDAGFRIGTNYNTNLYYWTNTGYPYLYPFPVTANTNVWSYVWTNEHQWVVTNTNIYIYENGQGLREANTNNLRLNNLRDEEIYYWDNSSVMAKETAKFAYTSGGGDPKYFKLNQTQRDLLNQVAGQIVQFTSSDGMLAHIDIDSIWNDVNQGNFPGKWVAISNKFNALTN